MPDQVGQNVAPTKTLSYVILLLLCYFTSYFYILGFGKEEVPGRGAGKRCQEEVPGRGAGKRCREEVPGRGARKRCQEEVPGRGAGKRCHFMFVYLLYKMSLIYYYTFYLQKNNF